MTLPRSQTVEEIQAELAENRYLRLRSMPEWNHPANEPRRLKELELLEALENQQTELK